MDVHNLYSYHHTDLKNERTAPHDLDFQNLLQALII